MSAVTCTEGAHAAPSRHDSTDARWYAIGSGTELVLIYPHETYKVGAVLSGHRAAQLIAEHAPELLATALSRWVHTHKEAMPF